jgi:hypothetical protein
MTKFTSAHIEIPPMTSEEGSALIREYLNRGESEKDFASQLSTELGGLPLAIAHFAGYVANSQCSIEYILESLQERKKSSQIWSIHSLTSAGDSNLILETVWDLAFRRLSADAKELLNIIAFLDPDRIPIDMFIGPCRDHSRVTHRSTWEYWEPHK